MFSYKHTFYNFSELVMSCQTDVSLVFSLIIDTNYHLLALV